MTDKDRIRNVSFFHALSPHSVPIADSTHRIEEIGFLITRLELESGVVGESYLLCFDYSPMAIRGALADSADIAKGFGVHETGRFLLEFERESEYFGNPGIHRWAMGAINLAMWDARGKSLSIPVWKMLGNCRLRIPLYGSGGWLSYSMEELLDEASDYVGRGFRAVKIKVGSPEQERDLDRLSRVRETVGPQVRIMMDANQGLDVATALRLAESARELDIDWFEEPISNRDYDGYAYLRQRAGISIAMGEREFDTVTLRELIRRRGIDMWQPDILRLGSVESWLASASLAAAHNIHVLPHYYKEYDVPLLMTIPNARGAESFDWVDPLITNPVRMEEGWAYPNEKPGWGFNFRDEFLTEIA